MKNTSIADFNSSAFDGNEIGFERRSQPQERGLKCFSNVADNFQHEITFPSDNSRAHIARNVPVCGFLNENDILISPWSRWIHRNKRQPVSNLLSKYLFNDSERHSKLRCCCGFIAWRFSSNPCPWKIPDDASAKLRRMLPWEEPEGIPNKWLRNLYIICEAKFKNHIKEPRPSKKNARRKSLAILFMFSHKLSNQA